MTMCRNVGGLDRVLRAILGAAALALAFTTLSAASGSAAGIAVALVGAVLLGTAAFGFCPAYIPFRLSTCKPSHT